MENKDIESQKEDKNEEDVKEQSVNKNIQNLLDQCKEVKDWALESETDPKLLFKTNLAIKQQIAEDCSLNNSQVDSENFDGTTTFLQVPPRDLRPRHK